MKERMIEPVANNEDKCLTYAQNMAKFNKAMAQEFYFEAILIDYAVIEDRMRSFMYHMGVLYDRNSYKANKGTAVKKLREIVVDGKIVKGLSVNSISGKKVILQKVMEWVEQEKMLTKKDKYLYALNLRFESLDIQALQEELDHLDKWCGYRNEIIHALMNKNMQAVNLNIEEKAQEGMKIARFLDNQLKIFKKSDVVRKAAGLPKE